MESSRSPIDTEALRRMIGSISATPLISRPVVIGGSLGVALVTASPLRVRVSGPLAGATVRVALYLTGAEPVRSMIGYEYSLRDRDDVELLAWHWHPDSSFVTPTFPHMHISAALRPARANGERGVVPLDKLHLPTGQVSLGAFIRMLIEEFDVEPAAGDWRLRIGLETTA